MGFVNVSCMRHQIIYIIFLCNMRVRLKISPRSSRTPKQNIPYVWKKTKYSFPHGLLTNPLAIFRWAGTVGWCALSQKKTPPRTNPNSFGSLNCTNFLNEGVKAWVLVSLGERQLSDAEKNVGAQRINIETEICSEWVGWWWIVGVINLFRWPTVREMSGLWKLDVGLVMIGLLRT